MEKIMDDLIEALTILRKYSDERFPTWCEHDKLHVCVSPEKVSEDDINKLGGLGFKPDYEEDEFYSFKFGSC